LGAALQADGEYEVRVNGLKHQKEKRSMDYFAGPDVSVKETSICIVDDQDRSRSEGGERTRGIVGVLKNPAYHFKRIGLEAGPLSQWLCGAFAEAGLPVICVETRHMQAVLKAQINKTDRNDARGIAQMMRVGLYRPVHVKTLRSQKLRMLLTHRKLLQSKAIAIENDLRGTLRNFGLKVRGPHQGAGREPSQPGHSGRTTAHRPAHAAFEEMVVAQGLGDADRQAPRNEKGDRGSGTPVGRDHAPHLG
jgi:transposase